MIDQATLDREYNPRLAVPDYLAFHERGVAASEKVRGRGGFRDDVRFGEGKQATLDHYPAPGAKRGSVVFVHGGYWRARDKSEFAYMVPSFHAHGLDTYIVNYDLCPGARLDTLVEQTQAALRWIDVAAPARPMIAVGHSAGAHLVAAALARAGGPLGLRVAWLVSGVFDLAPVLQCSVNAEIGLRADDAERLSPMTMPAAKGLDLHVLVGADETKLWIGQSAEFAAHLAQARANVEFRLVPGRHHFSILNDLFSAEGALTRAIAASVAEAFGGQIQ